MEYLLNTLLWCIHVKIYVGSSTDRTKVDGSDTLYQMMSQREMGMMISAPKWRIPEKSLPWALDNGAFTYWRKGEQWDETPFRRSVERIGDHPPDFIIVPDLVGEGLRSLGFSCSYLHALDYPALLYLPVQDGLKVDHLCGRVLDMIGGLFVGGTMEWKEATGEMWVRFAHDHGLPCHIGRVGLKRLEWAFRIEADSIDSANFVRNNWEWQFDQIDLLMDHLHRGEEIGALDWF